MPPDPEQRAQTHSKALNALFDSKSTILVGGGDVDRSVPRKASTDFLSPDLLIPLEVADVILTKTHAAFGFHSSSFEMAKSHLESEAILADGSAYVRRSRVSVGWLISAL